MLADLPGADDRCWALTFLGLKALEYYADYRETWCPVSHFEPGEWTSLTPPVNPQRVS